MTRPPLKPVADLAGHSLPEADLAEVASLLDGIMEEVQKLRELDLHDEDCFLDRLPEQLHSLAGQIDKRAREQPEEEHAGDDGEEDEDAERAVPVAQ